MPPFRKVCSSKADRTDPRVDRRNDSQQFAIPRLITGELSAQPLLVDLAAGQDRQLVTPQLALVSTLTQCSYIERRNTVVLQ
jgi:hypothetical protein